RIDAGGALLIGMVGPARAVSGAAALVIIQGFGTGRRGQVHGDRCANHQQRQAARGEEFWAHQILYCQAGRVANDEFTGTLSAADMAPQGQSGCRARDKSHLRQKSCMKTSSLLLRRQNVPRRRGFSGPVIQSSAAAEATGTPPLPRLSSARANNSPSFGSLPAASRVRRLRIRPTAARRAGIVLPRQERPEISSAGSSMRLMKPTHELLSLAPAR